MSKNRLDQRTAEELLADAERYERWAMRTGWNSEVSTSFSQLAADARAKAACCNG
ncbi:MAG: hypothetical protein ACXWJC_03140 [Croceibacterium sp.]